MSGPTHSSARAFARASAPVEPVLRAALARHRAGELDAAAGLYRQLLARAPDHVEALHLLGLTRAQSGTPEEAVALIGRAVALAPDFALAQYNLGNAWRDCGHLEEAVAGYRAALALDPNMVPAWTNLGVSLRAVGQGGEAAAAFRQAAALQPGNPEAHYNLGCGLQQAGKVEEAVTAYRRAVALQPAHADAQGNLAAALLALGRPAEALAAAQAQVALVPAGSAGHRCLSAVLLALGALAPAVRAAREATRLEPGDGEAWLQLGHALREDGAGAEAVRSYRRALGCAPGSVNMLVALAIGLQELGEPAEARGVVEQALARDPESAAAWSILGGLRTFAAGDPELATLAELADRLAAAAPLPLAGGAGGGQDHAQTTDEQIKKKKCPPVSRAACLSPPPPASGKVIKEAPDDLIHVEFTLGKALMDAGDAPGAFAALASANRRQRARLEYDVARDIASFAGIAGVLDAARMAQLGGYGIATRRPIFIVGMPRSGTTLVEQILASHPAIHGGGELKHLDLVLMARFAGAGSRPDWPQQLGRIAGPELGELGRAYLDRIAGLGAPGMMVTDKMPSNFRHAGLIHLMFPDALIIHCRRAMADNCLSCFATHFVAGQHFTYDLRELGAYYRSYAGLMAHWHRVIPADRLVAVDYEDVVADLAGQARRLVAACGLDWDDACLGFQSARRQVRTASVNQVRRPIYATSVARWQAYAAYLGPLAG